jgi:hypothetical protein
MVPPLFCCTAGPTTFSFVDAAPPFRGIGYNLPQEAPQAFAQAVVDIARA